ncbi:MAG: type II secretion system protein [Candidatus Liptonbacteria bacterium]|nr:type II secretion system protein [Candidatus Liptonbacteria bacterium]
MDEQKNLMRGFTLIEILIVVAIIAVLASAVLVGLGPVQRQGRDARRISDLRQVQTGLELYYTKCGYYPGGEEPEMFCTGDNTVQPDSWDALTLALINSGIGIKQIPNDPTASRDYFYWVSFNGDSYVLGATFEDPNNSALQNSAVDAAPFCTESTYCIHF